MTSVSFNSNIPSLKAQTKLSRITSSLSTTYERLSSGSRLNSASDGAAEISIADALKSDTRLATIAIRNANDAISITSIADSSLETLDVICERMAELAEQSANGVYSLSQRSVLQIEFDTLRSEVTRVIDTTKFNGTTLFVDETTSFQIGIDGTKDSELSLFIGALTTTTLGIAGSSVGSQDGARSALEDVSLAINSISTQRGSLGAVQNRLSTAISYLSSSQTNYAEAESRIRDSDIAQEAAEMVRLQVLQEANVAVLGQANAQPELVKSILSI